MAASRRRTTGRWIAAITVAQLREFLDLLPDWDQLTIGLNAIVLDAEQDAVGWCSPGVVAVCSWEADLWWDQGVSILG